MGHFPCFIFFPCLDDHCCGIGRQWLVGTEEQCRQSYINPWLLNEYASQKHPRLFPTKKHLSTKASKYFPKWCHIQEKGAVPGKTGQKSNLELFTDLKQCFDYPKFISWLKKPFTKLLLDLGSSQKLYFHINRSHCTNSKEGFFKSRHHLNSPLFPKNTFTSIFFATGIIAHVISNQNMLYPSQIWDMVRAGTKPWVPAARIASSSPQAFLIKLTANEELVSAQLRGAAPTGHVGRADLPQTVTWCDRHNGTGQGILQQAPKSVRDEAHVEKSNLLVTRKRAQANGWFRWVLTLLTQFHIPISGIRTALHIWFLGQTSPKSSQHEWALASYRCQGAGPDHTTVGHAKPTEIPPMISLFNPSPSSSFLPSCATTSFQWNQGNHIGPSGAAFTTNHHRHISLLKYIPGSGFPTPAVFQLCTAHASTDLCWLLGCLWHNTPQPVPSRATSVTSFPAHNPTANHVSSIICTRTHENL